jgi:hypothetical protein
MPRRPHWRTRCAISGSSIATRRSPCGARRGSCNGARLASLPEARAPSVRGGGGYPQRELPRQAAVRLSPCATSGPGWYRKRRRWRRGPEEAHRRPIRRPGQQPRRDGVLSRHRAEVISPALRSPQQRKGVPASPPSNGGPRGWPFIPRRHPKLCEVPQDHILAG